MHEANKPIGSIPVLWIALLILGTALSGKGIESRSDRETIRIMARVFSNGIPVEDLKKDDFLVYSNGEPQTISGFETIRKKILPSKKTDSPTILVLVCNIYDCNDTVLSSLDYIYHNLMGEQNKLILLTNGYMVFFNQPASLKLLREKTIDFIRQHSRLLQDRASSDLKKIDEFIAYLRDNTLRTAGNDEATQRGGKIHRHYYMKYFKFSLERYLEALRKYTGGYIEPSLESFKRFFSYLGENQNNIRFYYLYQKPYFPVLSKKNRALITKMKNDLDDRDWTEAWMDELDYSKKINKILGAIDHQLGLNSDFNHDAFVDFFCKKNIALYSLFLGRQENGTANKNEESRKQAKLNRHWKELSLKTGGGFIDLNDSPSALQSLMEHEDVFYTLSFPNRVGIKPDTLRVEMKNPEFQVISRIVNTGNNGESPALIKKCIQIPEVNFSKDRLTFSLKNFEKSSEEGNARGKVNVFIQLRDHQRQPVFETGKILTTEKNTVHISIDFPRLPPGDLRAILEVTDLISQITIIDFIKPGHR